MAIPLVGKPPSISALAARAGILHRERKCEVDMPLFGAERSALFVGVSSKITTDPKFMEQNTTPIVRFLVRKRIERRLTQLEVAHLGQVVLSRLGGYERGEVHPRIDKLMRWADALGYEVCLRRKVINGDS